MILDKKITKREAIELYDNYNKNNPDKTKLVFFKYDVLMDYLTELAKDPRMKDTSKAGIKLYFGEYSDKAAESKRDRVTVMFVPTMEVVLEDGIIINQDQLDNTNDIDQPLGEVLEAYNHGTMCPPYEITPEGYDYCAGSEL